MEVKTEIYVIERIELVDDEVDLHEKIELCEIDEHEQHDIIDEAVVE